MTRFKIEKIEFCVFLSIFFLSLVSISDGNFREKQELRIVPLNEEKKINKESPKNDTQAFSVQNIQIDASIINNVTKNGFNLTSNDTSKSTITHSISTSPATIGTHTPSINSGALKRGIFVILGLSVLVIAYMVFRSSGLTKTRAQMVRKYGVLAHRQDVEMRPLPLDEDDEEDNTVFDASNIPHVHGLQPQHS